MKRVLLALAAVAAITVGSSFINTAQAGHGHHHGHHHHGHHGHYHGHYHGHHHHGYYYRPAYPYGYNPYYGSGIGIYGRNFGFRIGY